jgi:DEAD/DEAH box helicase domain-containing protein
MRYSEFYSNAQRRSIETLIGMWAAGNPTYRNYLKQILEHEEPIMAEPVIQATFPWESASQCFGELTDIFSNDYINKLDAIKDPNFQFPKLRHPYLHQMRSWNALLNDQKSIVVTSGTGSGKTECFMMPVLYDLMNHREKDAIRAIFIYPLNALIGSQKKRMKAWCSALNNIRFGIYNGKTEESVKKDAQQREFPEIISREEIRRNPPQVLFSNPTMLEYMLVRGKDREILEKSKGKLRWILLDEAHTYTGSSASEMALLIRRILDAFGVSAEQVRFAATSATIGDKGRDAELGLKEFLSSLSGQTKDKIEVIGGRRVVPEINRNVPISIPEGFDLDRVIKLRERMNSYPAMKVSEITGSDDWATGLEIVDKLSEKQNGLLNDGQNAALLPTRSNFFARSIAGVYVCINDACTENKPAEYDGLGKLTTHETVTCRCGAPMLELVRCSRCNEFLAVGETKSDFGFDGAEYRMKKDLVTHSLFDVDNDSSDDDESDEEQDIQNGWENIAIAVDDKSCSRRNTAPIFVKASDSGYRMVVGEGERLVYNIDNMGCCPCCGATSKNFRNFRYGNSFLSRMLSYTLLEQAPEAAGVEKEVGAVWEGRKYIAFTDSRQGTARSALLQNIDIERIWIQSRVFHFLSGALTQNSGGLSEEEEMILKKYQGLPEVFRSTFADEISKLEAKKAASEDPDKLPSPRVSWKDLEEAIVNDYILKKELDLLCENILGVGTSQSSKYLKWLLMDQFAKRPKYANSPENLGLVRCVYPTLEKIKAPEELKELNNQLTDQDWRDFLKICIDFYIRENLFVEIPDDVYRMRTSKYFFKNRIYPNDSEKVNVKRWPSCNRVNPNRMILLLCAVAGWDKPQDLNAQNTDLLNSLMNRAFRDLIKCRIVHGNNEHGYALRLEEAMAFEILKEAWVCPVTFKPMDVTFFGYSPRLAGSLSAENIERYRIVKENLLIYPTFPYANRKDNLGNQSEVDKQLILDWIEERCGMLKQEGLWSNINERIFLKPENYLASEHSAQLDQVALQRIEKKFEENRLNILSCSTTMEMGVDIGGISEVVMNNVPPNPANYLQRAGRAGRRSETKSLAMTFCGPHPIGRQVMEDPLWAMTHEIKMPRVQFGSSTIIFRHANAYLFACFVANPSLYPSRFTVTESVAGFFGDSEVEVKGQIENAVVVSYIEFLTSLINEPNPNINNGLANLKRNTILEGRNTVDLIDHCLSEIRRVNMIYIARLNEVNLQREKLRREGFKDDSPAMKALNFKKATLTKQHLLGYLAEKQFTPNANMPTGVVDLELTNSENVDQRNRKSKEKDKQDENSLLVNGNPSRSIAMALAEYAPGRAVVVNQKVYLSEGIQLSSTWQESNLMRISTCSNGHSIKTFRKLDRCHCGASLKGLHRDSPFGYTEAIEPAGFAVDFRRETTRKVDEDTFSNVNTELINTDDWTSPQDYNYCVETRLSKEESEIMYFNNGNGFGYAVCIHCGRTEVEKALKSSGDNVLNNHNRLRGGRSDKGDTICTGSSDTAYGVRRNVLLTGSIQTDFVEIRLRDKDGYVDSASLLISLAIALKNAFTTLLGINEQEVSFNIKHYQGYKTIYLFDTNKGGAGYSNQFNSYMYEILDGASKQLECTCEKACTSCLVDRSTQRFLNDLDRHKAIEWLRYEKQLRAEVPQDVKVYFPDAVRTTRNINTELSIQMSSNHSHSITVFIDQEESGWDMHEWPLLSELQRSKYLDNKKVSFVFLQDSMTSKSFPDLVALQSWAGLYKLSGKVSDAPLAIVRGEGFNRYYFSIESNTPFNESWGKNAPVYFNRTVPDYQFQEFVPEIPSNSQFGIFYILQKQVLSKTLFGEYLKAASAQNPGLVEEVRKRLEGKSVSICYSDRYIKSKLAAIITLQFIDEFVGELDLKIEKIELSYESIRRSLTDPRTLWDNWSANEDRKAFMESAVRDLEYISAEQITHFDLPGKDLPHYRQMVVESDTDVLVIKPDGGFAHGWGYAKNVGQNGFGNYKEDDVNSEISLYNQTGKNGIQFAVYFEES